MASFSVVNNIAAVNAQANLAATSIGLNRTMERLTSGLRINQSGDDAAGLAVANGHRSTVAVLTQGVRNANDGLSTLQIKDGALNNISNLLDRLATLATQSASASSSVNRTTLDNEFQDVLTEIDREANVAGLTASAGFSVFVSSNGSNGTVGGTIGAADSTGLSLTGLDITTDTNAASALTCSASSGRSANTRPLTTIAIAGLREARRTSRNVSVTRGSQCSRRSAGLSDRSIASYQALATRFFSARSVSGNSQCVFQPA